jgi:hypothetical protein
MSSAVSSPTARGNPLLRAAFSLFAKNDARESGSAKDGADELGASPLIGGVGPRGRRISGVTAKRAVPHR